MSLETNLELNNQLVTRNNELLERLISTLASGVVMRPDAIAQVQEYHETVAKTKAALTLDDLPTIGERRAFAERLLDAPPAGRDEVKPKKGSSKDSKTEERTGPFYIKSPDGSAASELHTLRKLNAMLEKGHIEINRVEYLQLQEEFARKNAANSDQQVTTDTDDQPDFAALRKQAERLILQLAKGGYRAEAIAILEKQGAKKLGEVADENLADVIAQAEKALSVE
ncbi:hypothetical protein R228_23305 [Salmonella enterica]|nr:hypothetical protein [Salmonella enterica]ECS0227500.1 hypothetical protein [Salmonella enterica]EFU6357389.1 hypothetical protein [Salmonella enterica]